MKHSCESLWSQMNLFHTQVGIDIWKVNNQMQRYMLIEQKPIHLWR